MNKQNKRWKMKDTIIEREKEGWNERKNDKTHERRTIEWTNILFSFHHMENSTNLELFGNRTIRGETSNIQKWYEIEERKGHLRSFYHGISSFVCSVIPSFVPSFFLSFCQCAGLDLCTNFARRRIESQAQAQYVCVWAESRLAIHITECPGFTDAMFVVTFLRPG